MSGTRQDRLEVGYGLEENILDFIADTYLDKAHACYKEGVYPAGVLALLDCVDRVIGGESTDYPLCAFLFTFTSNGMPPSSRMANAPCSLPTLS